jgi:hypothetical protein
MYKEALNKVYTIARNDRGHINVMLVLQSCTDPLQVMAGSSTGTFPTSTDCTYDDVSIKVEEDIYVVEESFIAIKEESDTGIKQEEIPEDIALPDVKADQEQVNYFCIYSKTCLNQTPYIPETWANMYMY